MIGALLGLGTLSRGSELTVIARRPVFRCGASPARWPWRACCWCSSRCSAASSWRRRCRPWRSSRSCWPSSPPSRFAGPRRSLGARRRSAHQCFAAVRARRIRRHAHFRADRGSRAEIRGHRDHGQQCRPTAAGGSRITPARRSAASASESQHPGQPRSSHSDGGQVTSWR